MFSFSVTDIFTINGHTLINGLANEPFFSGVVSNGSNSITIESIFGNSKDRLNNLSFLLKKGSISKSDIGTVFYGR